MVETTTAVPVKTAPKEKEGSRLEKVRQWHPFETLHKEIDRIFEDFDRSFGRFPAGRSLFDMEPVWASSIAQGAQPAVDIVEHDKSYEISAELPGMDASNVEVKLDHGMLSIRGEKKDEREEKSKTRYVSERSYGLFERSFRLPEGADADKIEATFKKGVLTVTVPKSAESLKSAKKIAIKAS